MKLSQNALKILQKRYFAKGETWEKLCGRVAHKVAGAEEKPQDRATWEKEYKKIMMDLDFLPNSPTLRNFGRNQGCGSACFVLPVEDSRRSIFKTLSDAVDVQAYGGGTGMSFSSLRPKGDRITSTGGTASGPLSFVEIFDFTIGDIIKQGGTRDGANMGILRVDHPDIEDFLTAKILEGELKNFNLSVGITDAFMNAVENDRDYDLVFNDKIYNALSAREIWETIIDGAWKNGEPGIVFLDTINRNNPLRPMGEIEATNPCGEQPLLPYCSCNLGSINLSRMVSGDWVKSKAKIDWEKLRKIVQIGVRFLDSVITVNNYPIVEIEEMTLKTRQIGLGIMGFADMCIKLHIRYGSDESVNLAKEIMTFIYDIANETSIELGKEKGVAPVYDEYEFSVPKRRNGTLTTVAPTGTLSLIANCSSGCEPNFAFNYTKECLEGEKLDMVPDVVREWHGKKGTESLPEFFVTTNDVSVEEHIMIQAAFQNNGIDSGVSKTINAPYHTDKSEISQAFFKAWKMGCKGITFYREGSRDVQALYTKKKEVEPERTAKLKRGELKHRPRATTGPSIKMKTACGKLYVDPHFDKDGVVEVFIRTVGGGCAANTKALGVLLSYCLRAGISTEKIIRSMKSIHCPACTKAISAGKDVEVNSCAAGMGKALEVAIENADLYREVAKRIEDADIHFNEHNTAKIKDICCPDCGSPVHRAEGCMVCSNMECGWTRC
ncbi:MAG: ribonucleoside-diphosphate reductase, adenosylcobalamin-dependent [Desulfobacterales bacterium S5133MH16]|nr:MAG: ribonucleoside-diphosphate reductase, adenosylcobalamin-dependent [Desulfobacterales bacterium S5133MH16]